MKLPFEDTLFWWLYRRFRKRAPIDIIESMISWLHLDITVKQQRQKQWTKKN